MSRFDVAIGHLRHHRLALLRSRLETAGFELVEAFAWGFPFQDLYRTAVRIASRAALPEGRAETEASFMTRALRAGYTVFGRAMLPLFFFNLPSRRTARRGRSPPKMIGSRCTADLPAAKVAEGANA